MSSPETHPRPRQKSQLITLHERLFDSAAANPHAVALIAGDDTWTYERLTRYVGRLAQGLIALPYVQENNGAVYEYNFRGKSSGSI
jgi:non-ribosomal peptide synthetase component E (peptide arylation enzyme)